MSHYEFKSRGQKPIYKVAPEALEVRKQGISALRLKLEGEAGTLFGKELVSAMNFSVAEATKELKRRKLKEKK